MKRNVNDFIEEMSTNFSELFVETFLLRYLSEFDKNDLLENIQDIYKTLNKKISKNFIKKLKEMGYSKENINKYLK